MKFTSKPAEVMVDYFMPAINKANKSAGLAHFKERLMGITNAEMEMIYNSLTREEQAAFDNETDWTDEQEASRYLIFNKAINRFWDARAGYTTLDDEGILHITPKSSFLELNVNLNTFTELTQKGVYSIEELQKYVSDDYLSVAALEDVSAAILVFHADPTIVMDGGSV